MKDFIFLTERFQIYRTFIGNFPSLHWEVFRLWTSKKKTFSHIINLEIKPIIVIDVTTDIKIKTILIYKHIHTNKQISNKFKTNYETNLTNKKSKHKPYCERNQNLKAFLNRARSLIILNYSVESCKAFYGLA